jgi:hypothetical protein
MRVMAFGTEQWTSGGWRWHLVQFHPCRRCHSLSWRPRAMLRNQQGYQLTRQRGIQGADLATIMAKRTAKPEVRAAARAAAITKAKTEKRDKETKKSTAKAQGGSTAPKVSKQAMKGGAGAGAGKGGR